MSYELNNKLKDLIPYQPISGDYKIRLDANESYINLAEPFAHRIGNVVANLDFNRYPDPYAAKLCQAFAQRYHIDSELVTAGNGSDELISILASCFLEKGDTVLTMIPDFSMYAFYGNLYECKVETLVKSESLKIDPDAVLECLKNTGARMLLFSNPCNPTSIGLKREDVLKIVTGTESLVVVDEAYMDFWDQSVLDAVAEHDNLLVLKTCSKAAGAAAIRLGFAVANPTLTRALRAAKSPYNVNSLTQAVGEIILSEKNLLGRCVKEILHSRDELQQALDELTAKKADIVTVYPSCTNFIFLRMRDAKSVYEALLKRSVAVRWMGDYLRITAGNQEENRTLVKELGSILQ